MAIKKKSGSGSKESVVKKKKVSAGVTKSPVKKIRSDKKASAKHDTEKKPLKLGKTYLSVKDLKFFKDMIVVQKNEILENARRLRESLVDENTGDYVGENSTFSMHMAEHGTDEMEREKAYMLIQRDEKHLYYLENALERIEKKTYGLCISCGRPIDKGRLEAVPITQHCIKCKTNLSNGN
ncbi:MAG: TraR/DksA family transcriptional regulator [Ignavibacteria bacterium]